MIAKCVGSIFCLLGAAYSTASAQPQKAWPVPMLTWQQTFEWTHVPWTGDNGPYRAARLEIDQSMLSDTHFEETRGRFRAQALANPTDSLAFYRWAYATYEDMLNDHSAKDWHTELGDAYDGFYDLATLHVPEAKSAGNIVAGRFTVRYRHPVGCVCYCVAGFACCCAAACCCIAACCACC